jgi:hypothetical protein
MIKFYYKIAKIIGWNRHQPFNQVKFQFNFNKKIDRLEIKSSDFEISKAQN